MEESDYPVETPPPPPRKVRRRRITMREQGLDVVCCNGRFEMPREQEDTTPLVTALRELSLTVYNQTAVLKLLKVELEVAVTSTDAASGRTMQRVLRFVNKQIGSLRTVGSKLRYYILHVEGYKPLNEPREWIMN